MTPVETVFATAEPLVVPVSAEANTATKPGPPTKRPAMARARSTMNMPRARAHEEGAENDEEIDIGRRNQRDRTEHPLIRQDRAEEERVEREPGKTEEPPTEVGPHRTT